MWALPDPGGDQPGPSGSQCRPDVLGEPGDCTGLVPVSNRRRPDRLAPARDGGRLDLLRARLGYSHRRCLGSVRQLCALYRGRVAPGWRAYGLAPVMAVV